jgi:hypothetical protein
MNWTSPLEDLTNMGPYAISSKCTHAYGDMADWHIVHLGASSGCERGFPESPRSEVPIADEGGCAQSGVKAVRIYEDPWVVDIARVRKEYLSLVNYAGGVKRDVAFRTSTYENCMSTWRNSYIKAGIFSSVHFFCSDVETLTA